MIFKQCISRLASFTLFAVLSIASIGEAGAQTYPAPAHLAINTPQLFDTCSQGDTNLMYVCGAILLEGPALVALTMQQ